MRTSSRTAAAETAPVPTILHLERTGVVDGTPNDSLGDE
jgi:hypothetical protein